MADSNTIRSGVKLRKKMAQLEKLVSISVTLNSTIDMGQLIKSIISCAAELLECEAVSILLYDEEKSALYFINSTAEDVEKLAETYVPIENSLAGAIFLENKPLILNDVKKDPRHFSLAAQHVDFNTHSLMGVPMRIQNKVTGVLEALNKKNRAFTEDDLEILLVIASQAAVAIRNARLVADLQDAYNSTLEGWSSALDLRDKETSGHALRVADMTVAMARAMHLSEEEVTVFRQGALLHDIGKMGVPDDILLKPGPLTEGEWQIMRQHPEFAYRLLAPIGYLKSALEVPYCHHEKWDGTGYPRGLSGEQIPLSARVFSVIDVWDALSSDRPYRQTWPQEKVRAYIESQAGTAFDPNIVELFYTMLDSTNEFGNTA